MKPRLAEREPYTMYATPSRKEFEQLLSTLNPKQLNLLKKFVNEYLEYSKTETFKKENGRRGEKGDVFVITDCIKVEEEKRSAAMKKLLPQNC